MVDPLNAHHVSSAVSYLLVYAVVTAPMVYTLVVILLRIGQNRRLAADADRAYEPEHGKPLRLGAGVVSGTVVRPQRLAVRIEIDQTGKEWRTKKGHQHSWTETARRVIAEPFELRRPSGELLSIEPDQRVFLVDKLDQVTRTSLATRTRAAELTDGEAVFCVGEITEGERDQQAGLEGYRGAARRKQILRAPRGGRLLIASEPLGARYRARVRFHARWLLVVLGALALMHGGVFLGFNLRVLYGEKVDARVTRLHQYTSGSGKYRNTYHMVSATSLDGSQWFKEDAKSSTFRALRDGETVPFTVVDGWPKVSALGAAPTVSLSRALIMLGLTLFCVLAYAGARRQSRPWYDQRKIVDIGPGKL